LPELVRVNAREAFADIPDLRVVSALPGWISLQIPPDMKWRDRIVSFFRAQLEDLEEEISAKLGIAVDELLGNALEHGAKSEPRHIIEMSFIRTDRVLMIYVRDNGPGFSIAQTPHAAINNPPGEPLRHAEYRSKMGLRPGGFGIMLVKQVADELLYNEFGNAVLLIKYL
jgi:anti-sigma regulatory factor (Ser/Thr protein kinase)